MLYFDLFLAAFLLLCANVAVYRSTSPIMYILMAGGVFGGGPILLQFAAVPVWELAIVLVLVVVFLEALGRKRMFLPLSLGAAVLIFGGNSWLAWRDVERLKAAYPYESLAGRLPERSPAEIALSPSLENSLAAHEGDLKGNHPYRFNLLQELHESTLQVFINRPGFGSARMSGVSESWLRHHYRDAPPVPQPGIRSTSAGTWDEIGEAMKADENFSQMHNDGTLDFVHPGGFGYFKDRRHVAGFQPHQFSREPGAKHWKLQSLDLVGLVVHARPVAYISENLPRMDELRQAPTRDLNSFESAGLTALRGGEDLHVRRMSDGSVRMLGAVRSLKQCVSCHGGARGELLGAFSYELRREQGK